MLDTRDNAYNLKENILFYAAYAAPNKYKTKSYVH